MVGSVKQKIPQIGGWFCGLDGTRTLL